MTDSIATNGDPVAWLLIHSTRGYRKIVISKKTAESWHGWDRHPLYTNSLPTVDAAKLRELVAAMIVPAPLSAYPALVHLWATDIQSALNASEAT